MSNPFQPPSAISGYNQDPPSDDGQETSNNRVSWAKHKTKLTDPLKTYIEALGTAVNTAFATVDSATNLTQGTLPDARLSSNVPLKDAANTWSGAQTHSANSTWQDSDEVRLGTGGDLRFYHDGTDSYIDNDTGDLVITAAGDITLDGVDVTDFARLSQSNAFTNASQTISNASGAGLKLKQSANEFDVQITSGGAAELVQRANAALNFYTNTTLRASISAAGTFTYGGSEILTTADEGSGNGLDADTVDGIEAAALRDAQINDQDGDYTLVLADSHKTIYKDTGGSGETVTVPANSSVAFPAGTMVTIVNRGGGPLTIDIDTDTLQLAGTSTTGSRTLSDGGQATLLKVSSTVWMISGVGLS